MEKFKYVISLIAILSFTDAFSQQNFSANKQNSLPAFVSDGLIADTVPQKDIVDVFQKYFDKKKSPGDRQFSKKISFSVIPYAGYTLSTGFSVNLGGNVIFYTSADHHENISVLAADVSYDTENQKIILTRSEIWGKNNSYKIVSDLRYERYPTETYGLGTFTTPATTNGINYYYTRVYETVLGRIGNNYYAGIGYNLDYHYDISALGSKNGTLSDFARYGQPSHSTSSGFNLDFLYDDRKNPLNTLKGFYANAVFRENGTFLGSNTNWQSLQFDIRKFIKVSAQTNDVLAFWGLTTFTRGNVPYLDLPSTGGDMYNNAGRGYVVGRYRGREMLYLEAAYRYGLTKNGLLGAVAFVNTESFSEYTTNTFQRVAPAGGMGLRIKINKQSDTNICIDYAIGVSGSHGLFVNLGEVF